MAMKKIKPQYGKVVPPAVTAEPVETIEPLETENAAPKSAESGAEKPDGEAETKTPAAEKSAEPSKKPAKINKPETKISKTTSRMTADPNPFLQNKEVFSKANLTKIGYRMRKDYVEILDIIKKLKKGGYTLEAVLDDALTYYFENSEDGREALRKAEIFYS